MAVYIYICIYIYGTVFNHWNTMRRFGCRDSRCPFCSIEDDAIRHVVMCPTLWHSLSLALPLFSSPPSLETFLLFWIGDAEMDRVGCQRIIALNYIIFTLYNKVRFGLPLSRRAVTSAMKVLLTKWPGAQRLLR